MDPFRLTDKQRDLASKHLGLVHRWAKRYFGLNGDRFEYDELYSEGLVGLVRAASTFDPKLSKFSTYASNWILSCIRRYVQHNLFGQVGPRVGTNARIAFRLKHLDVETMSDSRRAAEALGVSVGAYEAAIQAQARRNVSLDAPGVPDDIRDRIERADERLEREGRVAEIRAELEAAMECLTQRERTIIRERYLNGRERTLQEVGDKYGLSRERIRQLEAGAFAKLRAAVDADVFL